MAKNKRYSIPYWDGVNSIVQPSISKKTELSHVENARAPIIGVLEKRRGQTKVGTAVGGAVFTSGANYGLAKFATSNSIYQGVFRISADAPGTATPTTAMTVGAFEIGVKEDILVSSGTIKGSTTTGFITMSNALSSIYSLNTSNEWYKLTDASAQDRPSALTDTAKVDDSLVLVNGIDYNRLISKDGVTVIDSTEVGSLYNSPRANRVAFYKNRIYLADFIGGTTRYKTTVVRSSYPMGLVALVDGDITTSSTVTVTDTKYIYSASGMNSYEIYRGGVLVTTITVTTVNETNVITSAPVTLQSADEIWIAGTFTGEKQYRWVSNPTSTGRDVKQYDTFKLSGGEEDEITLLDTIGNIMFIGNKNALMTWNDYSLQNFDLGIGCSSKTGSAKLLGSLYFIHSTGVYATTGTTPTLLSRKVERYINGATKAGIENSAAGIKGQSVFFTLGDVTLNNPDGSFWKTLSDTCLEYSVQDRNWYVHTNVPAEMFLTFINTAGSERFVMGHSGAGKHVKEFLTGNTDDGEEIFFRVDTQEALLMNEFEVFSNVTEIVTLLDRGSSMKTFIALDNEDFYEIQGTSKKGISKLKITSRNNNQDRQNDSPICRTLRMSFRDDSKQICRLLQVALVYTPTTVEESS